MKICIIGSGGFLAKRIIAYSQKTELDITVIGRSKTTGIPTVNFVEVDLLKEPIPVEICVKADIVIYAAGLGIQSSLSQSSQDLFAINSFVPIAFIERLKQHGFTGKLVTFGSYFEIGSTSNFDKLYTEKEVVFSTGKVVNDYCISKRLLSRYIADCDWAFGFYHCILPTIYGMGENSKRLIPYLINSLLDNKEIKLTSGTQLRQYLLANDAVTILFKMIDGDIEHGIYNFPCGETTTVKQIAAIIYNSFGRLPDETIFDKEIKKDQGMQVLQLDSRKLTEKIKQEPLTMLGEYIESTNFCKWN